MENTGPYKGQRGAMNSLPHLRHSVNPEAAAFVARAILFSVLGIAALIAFIVVRRTVRRRYFDRLGSAEFYVQQHWNQILSGEIPAAEWRAVHVDAAAIIALTLDRLDAAGADEGQKLRSFLRRTGLLGRMVIDARRFQGWRREAALVQLGRTRAPEAVPVLVAALNDAHVNTQLAAVRGLARTGLPAAAEAMLERFVTGELKLEGTSLLNALIICTRSNPRIVLPYLFLAHGEKRELLARVMAEVPAKAALDALGDDLLLLAMDSSPEVRACAARALAQAEFSFAFPALATLAADSEWFVRLRAVTSLGHFAEARAVPVLLQGVCDRNRHVRQRAAEGLARVPDSVRVLRDVLETGDAYALQAMIAELDRTGNFTRLTELLESGASHATQAESARLLEALEAGAEELRALMRIPAAEKTAKMA
jgi:HEAT repeat protein